MLEKILRSPLDCKEIQPVNPKGNQFWIFIEGLMLKLKTPILWPPDEKNWLIGKNPDAGKDWRQEEKGWQRIDGWMASLTGWTWVWASSRSWWWTGKPGMLQSVGSQIVGHDWVTELNRYNISHFYWTPVHATHIPQCSVSGNYDHCHHHYFSNSKHNPTR